MRIAIITPPYIPIPPPKYGGIEFVVYDIVETLHADGHEVFLFAPDGCKVSCPVFPYVESEGHFGLDSPPELRPMMVELTAKYAFAKAQALGVDVIHNHTLYCMKDLGIPVVHTNHGPNTGICWDFVEIWGEEPGNYFVSISQRQQDLYLERNPNINFIANVHNAIDVKNVDFSDKKEDFFYFIGRANWEKGLDLAVRVASKAKLDLKMSVKMSEGHEREFFNKEVKPWIDKFPDDQHFELHEEITVEQKMEYYKRAKCTLFTSQWEEPFGLVMIESMASGTPCVALRRGAAPEVIVDGKTGFIVDTEEEMVEAVKHIDEIDPLECRKHVEKHFSREVMASNYLKSYKEAIRLYKS